jgi:hypothetical protein
MRAHGGEYFVVRDIKDIVDILDQQTLYGYGWL